MLLTPKIIILNLLKLDVKLTLATWTVLLLIRILLHLKKIEMELVFMNAEFQTLENSPQKENSSGAEEIWEPSRISKSSSQVWAPMHF